MRPGTGDFHGRTGHRFAPCLAQGDPFLQHPAGVALDQPGAVGIDAVDNHLHRRRLALFQAGGRIALKLDDPIHPARIEPVHGGPHGGQANNLEMRRSIEPGGQLADRRDRVIQHDGQGHVFGIQRHPVAEEKEQDQGQDDGQGDAARIPADLEHFLAQNPPQAHSKKGCRGH
jgi:hypothetical protein